MRLSSSSSLESGSSVRGCRRSIMEVVVAREWSLNLSQDCRSQKQVSHLVYENGYMKQQLQTFVSGLGLSWKLSSGILVLLYFYSHYFFASGAAHIDVVFIAFLSVASALETPPYFASMVLAFMSNLMGGLTHYGIGSAPVFYGANYVRNWWGYGFLISDVNIIIWLGIGGVWWKFIEL